MASPDVTWQKRSGLEALLKANEGQVYDVWRTSSDFVSRDDSTCIGSSDFPSCQRFRSNAGPNNRNCTTRYPPTLAPPSSSWEKKRQHTPSTSPPILIYVANKGKARQQLTREDVDVDVDLPTRERGASRDDLYGERKPPRWARKGKDTLFPGEQQPSTSYRKKN